MTAAWGPIEFTAVDVAIVFAIIGLFPPLVAAVIGSVVHSLVLARHGEGPGMGPLFLRWWGWCTLGWIGAWLLAFLFDG
ncbi:MAG TPA: hypothetical protein VHN37_03955 [Actinomycetota bacterium]|nr:hypothetical protein [Actinomycetota bacterium]